MSSYSCMPNMAAIISKHNKILLQNRADPRRTTPPCNCGNKVNCPLEGKCRQSSFIYKASLKSNGIARHYYGCSETEFKTNHKQSLVHRHKRNAKELSKAIWNAKDAGTNPSIKWSIAAKTNPYQPGAKSCNLCLAEKLVILQSNPATTLNKRSELNSKCRHKNKFKLKSLTVLRRFCLLNVMLDVVSICSYLAPASARAFNALTTSCTFSCDFALVH